MDTPILITAWRRLDKLEKLLEAIKANKPKKIYISCDGPRKNNPTDKYLIKKVKNTIDELINKVEQSFPKITIRQNGNTYPVAVWLSMKK